MIVCCTLFAITGLEVIHPSMSAAKLFALVSTSVLIAGVSWINDISSLRASLRFAVHVIAGALIVWAFGPFDVLPVPFVGAVDLGFAAWPLTLLWIVGLTNAYNFMDGIDGIAGIQAVVAGIAWAIIGADGGGTTTVAALLAATSLGFLVHNWPPARIFMGDVGSAFLGFMFASIPLMAPLPRGDAPLAAFLVVWPFVFDTLFTFLRRLRAGEPVFRAHRSHLYQRLVIAGWSHASVTILYGGLATIGATLAVFRARPAIAAAMVVGLGVALLILVSATERRARAAPMPDRPASA